MRLIDADALINELQTYFDRRAEEAEFKGERTIHVTWNDALYYIKKAPTITWPEPLTDKEQRIFLAAMGREEDVCKDVDEAHPEGTSLVSVCVEIRRKVKKALWGI